MLCLLAIVVGLLSGFAAVLLKQFIHFIGHLLSNVAATGHYHWLYLVTPGVGMLLSLLFVKFLVRDDIGHGVTRVLLAISRNEAHIKPHNTWSSLVSSAMTIGLGGSVGAEAPIVYTGAAIGSNIARVLGLSYKQMTILLGCGAAGAIAGMARNGVRHTQTTPNYERIFLYSPHILLFLLGKKKNFLYFFRGREGGAVRG